MQNRRLSLEVLESRQMLSHGHDELPQSDSVLRYDSWGNAFAPLLHPFPLPDPEAALSSGEVAGSGPSTLELPPAPSGLPRLHSRPESPKKILLDFDGHEVSGTLWNSGVAPATIHAVSFDLDNDIASFNADEASRIRMVWERVAEDFAPFDVDVTTDDPGTETFTAGGRGIRMLISTRTDDARVGGTGNRWYLENAGGVAYLNSWTWRTDTPAWIFYDGLGNSEKNLAEATSHEVGHTLGLVHDGQGDQEYYRGHGTGATSWAPIMGIGYVRQVTQWSRGEYPNSTSQQDDLAAIAFHLSYRADDHPNQYVPSATPVTITNGMLEESGIIERNTDVDVFVLDLGLSRGLLDLQALPASHGANLDIQLTVHDSNGQLIAQANPREQLSASLRIDVGPGIFVVTVEGVGKEPHDSGYADYASLGQYSLTGAIQLAAPIFRPGDLDGDSTVDGQDLAILYSNWGDLTPILPPTPVGNSASVSYNPWNGEVFVSGNQVNAWLIESVSGGLSAGPLPSSIPMNDGFVVNDPQRVGETAMTRFSFANLGLGKFANRSLTDITVSASLVSFGPLIPGPVVSRYSAPEAAPGTAMGVFNLISGELAISANEVTRWYIESPSGGLTWLPPKNLPFGGGTIEDTNERIGETFGGPMSVIDLDLGPVAVSRLPDLKLYYQTSPTSPLVEGQLTKVGLGDLNLDGLVDGADVSVLVTHWTG